MATHFDEYEKQARQLEQIAKTLSKKSAKYAALKRAAWALAFVTMERHRELVTKKVGNYRRANKDTSANWAWNET